MGERPVTAKQLIGPSGEHYVLYRLLRFGLTSALAPEGAPEVDILVFPDVGAPKRIQVKARANGRAWVMAKKHESITAEDLVYAFVDMSLANPVTYLIPSRVVAEVVAKSHQVWLATPGNHGQPHKDQSIRNIRASYPDPPPGYPDGWMEHWKERWDLVGGPPYDRA